MHDTVKQALLQALSQLALEAKIADSISDIDFSEERNREYFKARAKLNGFRNALYLIPEISFNEIEKAEALFSVKIEKTA